ncbi:glycoside hydrolase family 127 protein [Konateibacter massiliensis]|uniref:glycoside hydrolase family 127 protein n=1 Tax=Konateibacter massiliensis TaxID=2002841 RepID=UPI000C15A656|nr:beta-L-arabinofuranosidase domain-containing protein [Konateibacter massiliensis]
MKDCMKRFTIEDKFFGGYEKLVKEVVIPYQEKVLKDEITDAEKSHAIENFKSAAKMRKDGKCEEEFYGMVFQDSDVAKWLEAAAYSLVKYPDKELESRMDEVIELIGSTQQEDGYLNTYFTVKEPGKRWTNLEEAHELYCAGHMMEAAVAYADNTGKTKLLDIMCKMADHIYKHFVEEKAKGYPGHPEVELALMRMYEYTGNEKYKELAKHFIDVRGVDSQYFAKESQARGWTVWGSKGENPEYTQSHAPVREQTKAVGHAVRAVYLYTGMAEVAKVEQDETLKNACKTLWDNITDSKMYVTGAIGSAYEGEAFTKDYHLPNDSVYGETCASIGLIFFARKMLELEMNSKYADVMERALYNCVLAGMQLDGQRFFYVNPLEVIPGISGEAVNLMHVKPTRPKWFACACCPPNVARLISSLGRYAWTAENKVAYNHLFMGGTLDLTEELHGKIVTEASFPYGDTVTYRFEPEREAMDMTIAIRMPAWSKETCIMQNGQKAEYEVKDGYAYVTGKFTVEDKITVNFDMSVKHIYAKSNVSADSGKVAFSKGPFIYCAEGADNDADILGLRVKKNTKTETIESDDLGDIEKIVIEGERLSSGKELYSYEAPAGEECKITLIPYYAWGNRGLNEMRVWLPEIL